MRLSRLPAVGGLAATALIAATACGSSTPAPTTTVTATVTVTAPAAAAPVPTGAHLTFAQWQKSRAAADIGILNGASLYAAANPGTGVCTDIQIFVPIAAADIAASPAPDPKMQADITGMLGLDRQFAADHGCGQDYTQLITGPQWTDFDNDFVSRYNSGLGSGSAAAS